MPMKESTVPGNGIATCDMLLLGRLVDSLFTVHRAVLPMVLDMVHCHSSHLYYCSACKFVPILYLGGLSKFGVRAGGLCCGCGCGHALAHE